MSKIFANRKRRGGRSDNQAIRQYERYGKFEGCTAPDVVAYEWSLDGCGETLSNEGWGNSATLVSGPFSASDVARVDSEDFGRLTRAERRFIRKQAGAVVFEETDGSVYVEWYTHADQLAAKWDRLTAYYEPDGEDD